MRKSLLVAVVVVTAYLANAQGGANPGSAVPTPLGSAAAPMFVYDIQGRPLQERMLEDIEGSPWLKDDWGWGAVKLRNGRFAKDVQLRFDLLNNKLFFQRDGTSFEFVMPVQEFMLGYRNTIDSQALLYRSGYPAIDKNSEETFYEVLADGKTQLLKYRYKLIEEFKPYNHPVRRKFIDKEQLYLVLPGNNIIKIKKDKDDILKALPERADAINKIIAEKNLKLKKEEDIAQLIAALNRAGE